MSGGVDSTACGLILREEYDIHGFFMRLAQPDYPKQLQRVTDIAKKCCIPLHVIDLREVFKKSVLEYFADSYQDGRTPNPCMICNPEIKFGLFMDAILDHGMDQMATGHYAGILVSDNCFRLRQGADANKDQSYFLARLNQQQLSRVKFPLAGRTKDEVYALVENAGFTGFRGQESQDVCFLGSSSVAHFLESQRPELFVCGDIVDGKGAVLGRHNGVHNYTVGQRKGLGISDATPWYVSAIDAKNNRIVVGKDNDLFKKSITIQNVLWSCNILPDTSKRYLVRIRYRHAGSPARLKQTGSDTWQLDFTDNQRAVTPGQFAVLYEDDIIIGSGEIQ